jgi:cyclophilin family peptidyl-prolyl cis-trans isomerase
VLSVRAFALNAPVLDAIPDQTVPAGKSLIIPLTASDADGDPVSLTVTSSSPGSVIARVKSGFPILEMDVVHPGNSGDVNDPEYAGSMFFTLFRDWTPLTVATIGGLTQGGYYNGLTFHVVYAGDIIQGGDPLANSQGGPGFTFRDEFKAPLIFSGDAQLAMANSGNDSNGSQFFITFGAHRQLDFNYTVFGQLTRGISVRNSIGNTPVGINAKPTVNVTVNSQKLVPRSGANNSDAILVLSAPGTSTASTITVTATDREGATDTKTFTATPALDTTDDPPFLDGSIKDVSVAEHSVIKMPYKFTDLEADPVRIVQGPIYPVPNALRFLLNTKALLLLPPANYKEAMNWVIAAYEQGAPDRGNASLVSSYFNISDYDINQISVGDVPYSAKPVPINATKGVALSNSVVAKLQASKLPHQATASINWGDGSVTTGTFAKAGAGVFNVLGSHTYANGGAFPLTVTVNDVYAEFDSSNNAVAVGGARRIAATTAYVLDSAATPITIRGTSLSARKKPPFNGLVATFTDAANPTATSADYAALIDWGDGQLSAGTISGSPTVGFKVKGSHTYADSDVYSIATRVVHAGDSKMAYGYSTMNVSGPLLSLPPFRLLALQGKWLQLNLTTTGKGTPAVQNHLTGQYQVTNNGQTASPAATLTIYYSTDNQFPRPAVPPVADPGDISLLQISIPTLNPGKHFTYIISKQPSANHVPIDLTAGTDYTTSTPGAFSTSGSSIISVLQANHAAPGLIDIHHVTADFPIIK